MVRTAAAPRRTTLGGWHCLSLTVASTSAEHCGAIRRHRRHHSAQLYRCVHGGLLFSRLAAVVMTTAEFMIICRRG
eukprot:3940841-Rhodomonas_salina.7